LQPEPGVHATFAREHEYERHGTVTLLAGIDLVTALGLATMVGLSPSSAPAWAAFSLFVS
jgi:hypothetical protein